MRSRKLDGVKQELLELRGETMRSRKLDGVKQELLELRGDYAQPQTRWGEAGAAGAPADRSQRRPDGVKQELLELRETVRSRKHDGVKHELLELEETMRSRRPDGVKQDLRFFIAYDLTHLEMARIAVEAGVAPPR